MVALNLGENGLTGPLPTSFASMLTLRDLRLFSNKLSGPIPKEWGALGALRTLHLQ
jgi:hypothetical protein